MPSLLTTPPPQSNKQGASRGEDGGNGCRKDEKREKESGWRHVRELVVREISALKRDLSPLENIKDGDISRIYHPRFILRIVVILAFTVGSNSHYEYLHLNRGESPSPPVRVKQTVMGCLQWVNR